MISFRNSLMYFILHSINPNTLKFIIYPLSYCILIFNYLLIMPSIAILKLGLLLVKTFPLPAPLIST